jgi:hypothetical protein
MPLNHITARIFLDGNKSKLHFRKIKSRLTSGNAYYNAVQNLVSSRLLSKNVKLKTYNTVVLPVVL